MRVILIEYADFYGGKETKNQPLIQQRWRMISILWVSVFSLFVCLGMLFIMKKTTVYKVLKTGNFENVNCVDTLLYSACLIFLRILRLGKPIPPSSLASKVLTEFLRRKYFYPLT